MIYWITLRYDVFTCTCFVLPATIFDNVHTASWHERGGGEGGRGGSNVNSSQHNRAIIRHVILCPHQSIHIQ